jgi:F-type H+-transporting ATPase subunit c
MLYLFGLVVTTGFALAVAAFAGALGQGRAIAAALEGIARQPEAGGRIQVAMIIGLAFVEALTIYTLVIALILQGKLPETKTILDILTRGLGGG